MSDKGEKMSQQILKDPNFTDLLVQGETLPNFGSVAFEFPKGTVQSVSWDLYSEATPASDHIGTGLIELPVSEADNWINIITAHGSYPLISVSFNMRFAYTINGIGPRVDELYNMNIMKVGPSAYGSNTKTFVFRGYVRPDPHV